MDRFRARVVGDLDYAFKLQIGLAGRRAPDVVCLIGIAGVDRGTVGVGVDGNGGDAKFAARSHHADGDLAAIGNQDFLEKLAFQSLSRMSVLFILSLDELLFHPTASKGWLGVTTSPSLT